MRITPFASLALPFVVVAASLAACGDFKDSSASGASTADGGSIAVGSDGGAIVANDAGPSTGDASSFADGAATNPSGHGPGPLGALPSGFCCNADTECRERHCVDVGGGVKACADECYDTAFCTTSLAQLACEKPADAGANTRGLCKPVAAGACIPQATYVTGTRKLGGCCGYKDGIEMAWECEGALATAVGSGPWVCTNYCATTLDCTNGYVCEPVGGYKMCTPTSSNYTCN